MGYYKSHCWKKCKVWFGELRDPKDACFVSDIQTHCVCLYSIVVRKEWMSHVVEGLHSNPGQKCAFSACHE